MLRKIANILFIVLAITSCTNNATTEKHQTVRAQYLESQNNQK